MSDEYAQLQKLLTKIVNVAPVALHEFRMEADGNMHMSYATPDIEEIYGLTSEELVQDFSQANNIIHPADRDDLRAAILESARTLQPFHHEWRIKHPRKGEIWVECHSTPERLTDGATAWYGYFHDITENKQARKDLELWGFALDHLHEGVYLVDKETRFLYVNNEACRCLDYTASELLRMGIGDIDIVFPLDTENWQRFWNTLSQIGSITFESLLKRKDGHVFPVEITANYFEYDNREYILALIRDISQRKETQEHLALLSFAMDHVGEAAYLIDDQARFLYVNEEACRGLGYSHDELLQMGIVDIDPDYSMEIWKTHWGTIRDQGTLTVETIHRTKSGHIFPVEVRANYFEYEGRGYDLAFVRDITERRQSEEHLALLSFAMNHVQEAAYLINRQSRFLYVNDEACRQLGYSRDQLLQLGVVNIDPDFPMEHWLEHWNEIRTKGSITIETSHQRKDGSLFPIEVSANYFEYNGEGYNLALVRDITERKLHEARERMRTTVLEKLAQGATLQEMLTTIARGIEEQTDELLCSILLLDTDGKHLTHGAGPSLPDFYNEALDNLAIGPAVGSCGAAAWSGQRVIVEDIQSHPNWTDYRELAKQAGLLSCWSQPICDKEGHVLGTFAIYHRSPAVPSDADLELVSSTANLAGIVIEHRHAQAALQESEERFRQMANNIEEIFWLTDVRKQQILYVSPAYEKIFGRCSDELYANPSQWLEAVDAEDKQRVQKAIMNLRASVEYNLEYRITRPDGTLRYIQDRAFPIRDATGTVYRIAGLAQDVTARKEQELHIEYLAYHDGLTDLPNRALTMDRLRHAMTQAQRHNHLLGVLFIDLDRFKTINDTLGHPVGDALLQQVGQRLSDILRKEDTVGRVGGDEFLVLLLELATAENAAHVTEKLLACLAAPFKVAGHDLRISASIGISMYPRDADQAVTLVQYADTALYLAKEEGRSTFRFFSPELDARIHDRLHKENDLRRAIEQNELLLHYQPLINLSSGKVTAIEALARWQHSSEGLIMPADFIPLAEDIGLIPAIGEWVLRTASTQAQIWQAAGISNIRVCVNLSQRQLTQPDFTDKVRAIIDETGCDPRLLEFEITESSIMSQPEQAISKLEVLHDMGIQLALDDFGTGYSSLAYLKRLPLDRLKIDRSFVSGIPVDSNDMAIIQTIIVLARQLGLAVVAEGVETEVQKTFLNENGCDEIQGFLLCKPMPFAELKKQFGLAAS